MKSNKEKKVIKHRILDGNAILGMVILTVVAFFMIQTVLGLIFGGITGILAALTDVELANIGAYGAIAFSSFVMLAIHKRWFYPEFDGNLKFRKDIGKWILVAFAVLLAIIIPDLIIMLVTGSHFAVPTLTSVMTALMAGTSEEVIFRAVPGSYGMRQCSEEKKIPTVVIVTSVLFALVHATNIFAGADVLSTVIQIFTALSTGLVLCALFLRSGNILPSMIVHFLYDVYALMNADAVSETGIMENALSPKDIIINIILMVVEILIALILLKKSVWGDILDIWKKKWSKQAKEPENSAASAPEAEVG